MERQEQGQQHAGNGDESREFTVNLRVSGMIGKRFTVSDPIRTAEDVFLLIESREADFTWEDIAVRQSGTIYTENSLGQRCLLASWDTLPCSAHQYIDADAEVERDDGTVWKLEEPAYEAPPDSEWRWTRAAIPLPNVTAGDLRDADAIYAVDQARIDQMLVFGRDNVKRMPSIRLVYVAVDRDAPGELEKLLALVRAVKGHDEYTPDYGWRAVLRLTPDD